MTYLLALTPWSSLLTSVGFLNPPKSEDKNVKTTTPVLGFLNEFGHNCSTAQFFKANCAARRSECWKLPETFTSLSAHEKGRPVVPSNVIPRAEGDDAQGQRTLQAAFIRTSGALPLLGAR